MDLIVEHGILLKKLDVYFSNRSQSDSLGTTVSQKEHITYDVPQRSVSRPILFNLFINDLVNVSNKFKYVFFDDNFS